MTVRLTGTQMRAVVEAAHRAPSVLNTQPWHWRTFDDMLELLADSTRVLRVADPMGRFMVISCGAALFNARIALRHFGLDPTIRLVPDPEEPRLLARIRLMSGSAPDPAESHLFEAIPHRHTNRGPFADRGLEARTLEALVTAATAEGAILTVLTGPEARRVLQIADEASRTIAHDPERTGELAGWIRTDQTPDGIPATALGPRPNGSGGRIRDFDPVGRVAHRPVAHFEEQTTVAVLATYGDSRTDWLRGGQALQRVLLTATLDGIQASFRNEPLEVLQHRWRIRDAASGVGHPQMILRLGYGEGAAPTPRRPVHEVVESTP